MEGAEIWLLGYCQECKSEMSSQGSLPLCVVCPQDRGSKLLQTHFKAVERFFFFFVRLPLWHVAGPRLGVHSELHLPGYTTATPDPCCLCDLYQSLCRGRILHSRREARDEPAASWTRDWGLTLLSPSGNSSEKIFTMFC